MTKTGKPKARRPRKRKRAKYGAPVSFEGFPWTYRRPLLQKGRWRVDRRDRFTGAVGRVTLEATSYTDAVNEIVETAEKERKRAAEQTPADATPVDITVGAALTGWKATFQVRPATLLDYEASIELYKRSFGEEKILRKVELADVEDRFFKSNGKAEPPGWADRKGKTKIKHRMQLIRFWAWALRHGYADRNVPALLEVPRSWRQEVQTANRETGQALTLEEARKLLDAAREPFEINFTPEKYRGPENTLAKVKPPPELYWFLLISLRTGLRASNILPTAASEKPGLTWSMVDLKEGTLSIDGRWMKNGLPFRVPLHPELVEALKGKLKGRKRTPRPDEPIVGEVSEMKKSFARALKIAGLGDRGFRVHDLRHCWGTWIGEVCTHVVTQILLGHAQADVTGRYSRHQTLETVREQLNRVPRLLGDVKALVSDLA